jgi:hypothetical protein
LLFPLPSLLLLLLAVATWSVAAVCVLTTVLCFGPIITLPPLILPSPPLPLPPLLSCRDTGVEGAGDARVTWNVGLGGIDCVEVADDE